MNQPIFHSICIRMKLELQRTTIGTAESKFLLTDRAILVQQTVQCTEWVIVIPLRPKHTITLQMQYMLNLWKVN